MWTFLVISVWQEEEWDWLDTRIWRTRNLLDSWVSLSVIEGYEGDSQENNINSWSKQATPSPQRPPDINEFLSSSWHLDIHEVVNQDFFVSHEMLKKFKIYRKLKIRSLDNFIRGTESSPWRLKTIIILCVMFHDWYLEQLHVQKFKQNMWNLVPANICQIILDFYCWILFQTTRTLIRVSFSRDHKRIEDFRERGQEKEFYNVVIEDDDNVDNVGADADPEHCPSL